MTRWEIETCYENRLCIFFEKGKFCITVTVNALTVENGENIKITLRPIKTVVMSGFSFHRFSSILCRLLATAGATQSKNQSNNYILVAIKILRQDK